jgi:hypothetical protein
VKIMNSCLRSSLTQPLYQRAVESPVELAEVPHIDLCSTGSSTRGFL